MRLRCELLARRRESGTGLMGPGPSNRKESASRSSAPVTASLEAARVLIDRENRAKDSMSSP